MRRSRSPQPERRRGLAALLVGAILVVASCGAPASSPPAVASGGMGTPAGSAGVPATGGPADIGGLLSEALQDGSLTRLATTGSDLDAAVDQAVGRTAALGGATVDWLTDRRSATVVKALDAARVEHSAISATGLSRQPTAQGGAGGLMTWVGSTAAVTMGLSSFTQQVGSDASAAGQPTTSHDVTTINGLTTEADTTTTFHASVSGSTVVVDGDVTQASTTTDAQGAVVSSGTYRSHVHAELSACPDSNGTVSLTMSVDLSSSTSVGGSFTATATSHQKGQVGDDAYLQSVTEDLDVSQQVVAPSGSRTAGSSKRSVSFIQKPNGGGFDRISEASGSVGQGTMDPTESIRWANFMQLTVTLASMESFKDAQKQWRGGKCVRVESSEHSRNVSADDTIRFDAEPVQAIDGTHLTKPIVASLTGSQAVQPQGTEQPAPASFTYVAGPGIGDRGTVTLTSTSNRGIGTLALTFVVEPSVVLELEIDSRIVPTVLNGLKVIRGHATAKGRIRLEETAPGHWSGDGNLVSETNSAGGGCMTVRVIGDGSYDWQVRDVRAAPDVVAADMFVDMDAGTASEQPDIFAADMCSTTLKGTMNTWENAFFTVYNARKGVHGLRVTQWTLKATPDTWIHGGLVATAGWSGSCPATTVAGQTVKGLLECTDRTTFRLWAVPAP
jgi:hypothetical protein